MKKILVTVAILVLGAILGVGCYLAYQQFHTKISAPIKTSVTVKEQEDKHRLDMELAVTDAEKEFFAMMNNYFDAIDKAVEYKRQGQKTDFKEINFMETKIAFYLLFNEDKIRKELMREQLLPLMNYYTTIMEKYGINNGLKDNALIKADKPKRKSSGLISGPHQSIMKSTYFKNGVFHDSIVISTTYIYATKRVIKNTSYVKVDLNDYFNPEEADWNYTELSDEDWKYLHSKNVFCCDTTISNYELKGWFRINKWTETQNINRH